ncbi:MAG TPA: polyprenyl synthetase family protein, partial [Chlamydiales bacterium]
KTLEEFGEKTALRDACEYALMSGGKRIRPALVLMIAEALGHQLDAAPAALSVEFFHTASLIADDLPCMDNDDARRARPSLHRAFPEGVALLASYTLIASGYEGIYRNGQLMKSNVHFRSIADRATILSLEIATRCAGIHGATNGQFLDLFPSDQTLSTVQKIITQKTVTLFQISFVLGWLFGGGNAERLDEVEQVASHLGMAFQIGDDIQDMGQDGTEMNLASMLGQEKALLMFHSEMDLFEKGLKRLSLWNGEFAGAVEQLLVLAAPAGKN